MNTGDRNSRKIHTDREEERGESMEGKQEKEQKGQEEKKRQGEAGGGRGDVEGMEEAEKERNSEDLTVARNGNTQEDGK